MRTADINPVKGDEEAYAESWEFRVDSDTWEMKSKFQIANLGFGDLKGQWVGYVIRKEDGETWNINKKFDASQWTSTDDGFSIAAGPWSMEGEPGRFRLRGVAGAAQGLTFDVMVEGPPYRPGTGLVLFGQEQSQYLKAQDVVSNGSAHGTIVADGVSATVDGVGYGYHTALNIGLHEMADRTYHFRAFEGDVFVEWRSYATTERFEHAPFGFLVVMYGDVVVFESTAVQVEFGPSFTDTENHGYQVSRGITLHASGEGGELRLRLGSDTTEISNPLAHLPALERAVAESFIKPMRYYQEGRWRLDLVAGDVRTTIEANGGYSTVVLR